MHTHTHTHTLTDSRKVSSVCVQVDEIYSVPDVGTVVGGTLYR